MTTKHSKLLWTCNPVLGDISDSEGKLITMVSEANAEFIVKACNNHYQLLEACKTMRNWYEERNLTMGTPFHAILEHITEAIYQAEGES